VVSNIQDYWVFGLFPPFGILENRKHDVSETGSVCPQDGNRPSFRNVVFSIL
jgi:hypothetical protein